MSAPLVSIVTATYNRSRVLAVAMETVRRQTWTDWELHVVGDACTDDTAAVVASLGDERVRFSNLAVNGGEQAGPNNYGIAAATGRYVALLNHDDLWLADHLSAAVGFLEESGADLVFTEGEMIEPSGERTLIGRAPGGCYEPDVDVIPSTWVFRRESAGRVGPWRSHRRCHLVPSQDWLFRAWKAGLDMRGLERLTVVHLPAGRRQNAYARGADEHALLLQRIITEPDFAQRELPHLRVQPLPGSSVWKRLALGLGLHPKEVRAMLRLQARGRHIEKRRRVFGLPAKSPRPAPGGQHA